MFTNAVGEYWVIHGHASGVYDYLESYFGMDKVEEAKDFNPELGDFVSVSDQPWF